MSLTDQLADYFDPKVRGRGNLYFKSSRVEIIEFHRLGASAEVEGSYVDPYDVTINWSRLPQSGCIHVECDCPHFDRGEFCKHIWAALLSLEVLHREELPRYLSEYDDIDLHHGCSMDFEDEIGEGLLNATRRTLSLISESSSDSFASMSPRTNSTLQDFSYQEVDPVDEPDIDPEEFSAEELLQQAISTLQVNGKDLGVLSLAELQQLRDALVNHEDLQTSAKSGSHWKDHLASIQAKTSAQEPVEHSPSESELIGEIVYILDVSQSFNKDKIVLQSFFRQEDSGRSDSQLAPVDMDWPQLHTEPFYQDHLLLDLLQSMEREHHNNGTSTSAEIGETPSHTYVLGANWEPSLGQLIRKGTFFWRLNEQQNLQKYGRPIRFLNLGNPWKFRLTIDQTGNAHAHQTDDLILSGELYRDNRGESEVLPLNQAVLILSDGLVLLDEELGVHDISVEDFAWVQELLSAHEVRIPRSEKNAFLKELHDQSCFPELQAPEDFWWEDIAIDPVGKMCILAEYQGDHPNLLYINISFLYGEFEILPHDNRSFLVDEAQGIRIARNWEQESLLIDHLDELDITYQKFYHRDDANSSLRKTGFANIIASLLERNWLVEAEGRQVRPAGDYSLSVSSGIDWFDVDGVFNFENQQVPFPDILKAVDRGEKFIKLGDGTTGMLPEDFMKKFHLLPQMGTMEDGTLRFTTSQTLLLDALLQAQPNVSFDTKFKSYRKKLSCLNGIDPRNAPRGFQGELRNYQEEGLGWLHFLKEFQFGGCLADDMGLGKTVQVLALLESRRIRRKDENGNRAPSLAVVPKSLIFNWIEEGANFTPRLKIANYTGPGRELLLNEFHEYDLFLTTYGTLRRDIFRLKEFKWDYLILDEAQAIKNSLSQTAKAAKVLQGANKLALTGTPVENHLGELWSLFEFLNPGLLGKSSALNRSAKADDDAIPSILQGIAPYILRRTKSEVLTELPEKSEQILYCDLTGKQKKQYNELRDYYRAILNKNVEEKGLAKAKFSVLEGLLRLRQLACHPGLIDAKLKKRSSAKFDLLLDQITEVVSEGHKALVFSQFTQLLALLRKALDKRKIPYEYLDGKTHNRKDCVHQFQTNEECPLFLISLKAGGHGLNLTAADYVYILDPWWNPAVEAQAVDRAHRMGQTKPVFAYRLIARDTVEERILDLQQNKKELAEAIVTADKSLLGSLTADDLQSLFS